MEGFGSGKLAFYRIIPLHLLVILGFYMVLLKYSSLGEYNLRYPITFAVSERHGPIEEFKYPFAKHKIIIVAL